MRDHFSGGRVVWVLCKRAPATLYPHHSVGVLVAVHLVLLSQNSSLVSG
jgi:hypothetical protein